MPDSVDVGIAKAVVTALEAASLSQVIAPERSDADWERPLETAAMDDDALHVDVVTVATKQGGRKVERASRGLLKYTIPVDIAVRKRLERDDKGHVPEDAKDPFKLLVEEICEYFFVAQRLSDPYTAVLDMTEVLVSPVKRHLREMGQFTGIVRMHVESVKQPSA